jgi:Lrp/AsnC family transcriptional regulator
MVDQVDRNILGLLQKDATLSSTDVGQSLGIAEEECARRISALESDGVIQARVAVLDAKKVGVGVTVFVAITTPEHSQEWLDKFHSAVAAIPEVMEFYRMSGQVDYLLRVSVPDIEAYDAFYKKLIQTTELKDVSSTFAMEQIKFTTALPLEIDNACRSAPA